MHKTVHMQDKIMINTTVFRLTQLEDYNTHIHVQCMDTHTCAVYGHTYMYSVRTHIHVVNNGTCTTQVYEHIPIHVHKVECITFKNTYLHMYMCMYI